MAKLVCQAGPSAGHEYPIGRDKLLFGRQKTCDVQIMDSMASREHFVVRRDGSLYTLVDLESRNGTFLNDRKVSERQLEFGDVVRVGSAEYLLVKEDGDTELKDLLTRKYEIQEKIGEGGMGIVYKALQKSMDRIVAIKILAPKYCARPRLIEQFIREARAAGALNHPNIIQVHDVGTENSLHYFSMEYVDGPTCMKVLKSQGPMPEEAALEVVQQTAKALEYAHANRLIHRDIKPDNIMVTGTNMVKLADLGISKTFDEAEAEGKPKRIVGTPHYMAPEAAQGKKIDHRVDLYSLGATLYHLLSGRTPFSGTNASDVLKAHVKEPLPPIESTGAKVSEGTKALLGKLLAKNPDDRFATATEVADAVAKIRSGSGAPGEETVMLRRLVSDTDISPQPEPDNSRKRASAEVQRGGRSTGETNGPGKTTGGTRGSRTRPNQRKTVGQAKTVVSLVVVVLVLLLGWVVFDKIREAWLTEQANLSGTAQTDTASTATPGAQTDRGQQPPPTISTPTVTDETQALIDEVSRLERRLAVANDAGELAAMAGEVEPLLRQVQDDTIRTRITELKRHIEGRLAGKLAELERRDLASLESDIGQLLDTHEYEAARQRVAAFSGDHDDRTQERLVALNGRIDDDERRYLERLSVQIERHAARGDGNALRAMRDELPAALLDHPVAKELAEALQELDQEALAAQREILEEAQGFLADIDLPGVAEVIKQKRGDMSPSPVRDRLDKVAADAAAVQALFTAMDQAIKARPKPPRYRGRLWGSEDPDIVGASEKGLHLEVATGGLATVPWRELKENQFRTALKLALPTLAADQQSLVDRLMAMRK
jgi:serine/threonine protein kinase